MGRLSDPALWMVETIVAGAAEAGGTPDALGRPGRARRLPGGLRAFVAGLLSAPAAAGGA
ncbi:hypothetical protein ACPPVO_28190 [Dactylosporangium sp. McL0621]|uniref:hypothetical protein n=1 Tax=Dactylosporangium sp. McL0621 TaxID=3415678 RepID=UPI003CF2A565